MSGSSEADRAEVALARRILALIDLTDLGDSSTEGDIVELCRAARTPNGSVAAVCIWPRFVELARRKLDGVPGEAIRVATVVNFPSGDEGRRATRDLTRRAVDDGADEIDVVIPYRRLLGGDEDAVSEMVAAVVEAAGDAHVKAILETGELPDQTVVWRAARLAVGAGAHFIKTSTGKSPVSATVEAAHTMLEVIRAADRPVGLKPSGGIRTVAQAAQYLRLADEMMGPDWATPESFRFGASSLLGDVLARLQ